MKTSWIGATRAALTVIFMAVALLAFAASANAAFVFQNDEGGANEPPDGQVDLTRMGVDTAALPATLGVQWNWDETGLPGANTGDACAMFDTDDDGRVNFSMCVTVGDDPLELEATRVYSCGDDKVDRCTNPIVEISPITTSCTVAQTATDPFAAGDEYPNDTTADCAIAMADVGGAEAVLVNTCSFPSQEPNSNPFDCILVSRDAFLVIVKVAAPDDGTQFPFALDGDPAFTAEGSDTSGIIPIRSDITHTLTEDVPDNWSLDSASCSPSTGTPTEDGLTEISAATGTTVTCTFNDSFDKFTPTLTTTASESVNIGGFVHDVAQLGGTYNDQGSGTITFRLYGPDDETCTGTPVESVTPVDGDGDYESSAVAPAQPGVYRWIAEYSGDDYNNPVLTQCGDPDEIVTVHRPAIDLRKTVSATPVEPGTIVTFTVEVENTGTSVLGSVNIGDDTCIPLVGPAGDVGDDLLLDPGEIWTYTCSMAINVDTVNVATVTAIDPQQTVVGDQDSASVTVLGPSLGQSVATLKSVRLSRTSGCTSRRLRVTAAAAGGTVKTARLYIDGRLRATRKSGRFVINTASYSSGLHRIRVVTEFTDGQTVTRTGSFRRCQLRATRRVSPQFTG